MTVESLNNLNTSAGTIFRALICIINYIQVSDLPLREVKKDKSNIFEQTLLFKPKTRSLVRCKKDHNDSITQRLINIKNKRVTRGLKDSFLVQSKEDKFVNEKRNNKPRNDKTEEALRLLKSKVVQM